MVYLIHCPSFEATKIGCAGAPERRLAEIQACCPATLYLIGLGDGYEEEEKELHDRLRHLRIHSEWFRHCQELVETVAEVLPSFRHIGYQEDGDGFVVGAIVSHPKHGEGRIVSSYTTSLGRWVRVQFQHTTRPFALDRGKISIERRRLREPAAS